MKRRAMRGPNVLAIIFVMLTVGGLAHAGDASPLPSKGPLYPLGISTPDPQIAVGRDYVLAVDTGNLSFYDRAKKVWIKSLPWLPKTDHYATATITAQDLFQPFFKTIDEQIVLAHDGQRAMPPCEKGKPCFCDPDDPKLTYDGNPLPDSVKGHITGGFGCIQEAYDTRVLYDAERHRFWIASAVRNMLFRQQVNTQDAPSQCPTAPGLVTQGPNGTIWDPVAGNPAVNFCHTDWPASWAHRFIVVAVSQVNDKGEEDLNRPFHRFVLVDEYNDWPQMTVHGNYLVLNHRALGSAIYVFNAEALANGNKGDQRLGRFSYNQFVSAGPLVVMAATQPIYLVNTHGSSDGLTYLVSGNGSMPLIFALSHPKGDISGTPTLLAWPTVIGLAFQGPSVNPVFRDGKLYIASHSSSCDDKYTTRVVRLPIIRDSNGHPLQVDTWGEGFLDLSVGDAAGDNFSYVFPSVEVTKNDDIVLSYERVGLKASQPFTAGLLYNVVLHGEDQLRSSQPLQDGIQLPPGIKGVSAQIGVNPPIDLGGIAVDPLDDTGVWMSGAYGDSNGLHAVIGAVKP